MLLSIEPTQFAKLMSLPRDDRRDLLEFLGATALPVPEAGRLLQTIAARAEARRDSASFDDA
jgi:hypothetical protein